MGIFAQTTQWKDMYKVKKRDTVFSIAKDNGLTVEELIAANPDMKMQGYELKKGDYIFIPYPKIPPQAKSLAQIPLGLLLQRPKRPAVWVKDDSRNESM